MSEMLSDRSGRLIEMEEDFAALLKASEAKGFVPVMVVGAMTRLLRR